MRTLCSFPESKIGPATRAIVTATPPTHGDDVIVQKLSDGEWIDVARYNSLSNDYAYSSAREHALRLNAPRL